jgi:hypothetical protein
MVIESKPLPEEMLKETYVLLEDASALYYALKLHYQYAEDIPDRLVSMFEDRLGDAITNMLDVVNPPPF